MDAWFGCLAEWSRERKCDRKQTSATENRQRETENREKRGRKAMEREDEERQSEIRPVSCFTLSTRVKWTKQVQSTR